MKKGVRLSAKKPLGTFDDLADEAGDFVADQGEGRLEFSIPERWIEGDCAIHAHLNLRVRPGFGESEAQNFCLVFQRQRQRSVPLLQKDGGGIPLDHTLHRLSASESHVDMEGSVLVGIGEPVKDGELVCSGVHTEFPSLVRLQVLDECPSVSFGIDAFQGAGSRLLLAGPDLTDKVVKVGVDGEEVPAPRPLPAFGEHELPDEVIQSGSEVVNRVSADDAEAQRRRLLERWANTYLVPGSVKVHVERHFVGVCFPEDAPFMVEDARVFPGPLNLAAGSI